MAIIMCPECGKEVSSAAFSCPSCGYPLAAGEETGYVRIKTPGQIVGASKYSFRKTKVTISSEKGILWAGELGNVARFKVNGPTHISIDMGNNARVLKTTVHPFSEYRMVYVCSRWWNLPEYELVEV